MMDVDTDKIFGFVPSTITTAVNTTLRLTKENPIAATCIGLGVVCGLRHVIKDSLFKSPPKPLRMVTCRPGASATTRATDMNAVSVVLVHGMWHGAWYFTGLQRLLATHGISSYAVDLQGDAADMNRSHTDLVADLEATLDGLALRNVVVVGHSQGGVITQYFLRDALANRPEGEIVGVVLLATIALGSLPPPSVFFNRRRDGQLAGMYYDRAYAYFCATGRIMSRAWAQRIFTVTSGQTEREGTTMTTILDNGNTSPITITQYVDRLVAAPADGYVTMTHFLPLPSTTVIDDVDILVLGAADDVIYPPDAMKSAFDARYPHATHAVAQGQAHCFVDPGWEQTMGEPLAKWCGERVMTL